MDVVYSANVSLFLEKDGVTYPLSHVAPDYVISEKDISLSCGEADVFVVVDGLEHRRRVQIDEISQSSRIAVRSLMS